MGDPNLLGEVRLSMDQLSNSGFINYPLPIQPVAPNNIQRTPIIQPQVQPNIQPNIPASNGTLKEKQFAIFDALQGAAGKSPSCCQGKQPVNQQNQENQQNQPVEQQMQQLNELMQKLMEMMSMLNANQGYNQGANPNANSNANSGGQPAASLPAGNAIQPQSNQGVQNNSVYQKMLSLMTKLSAPPMNIAPPSDPRDKKATEAYRKQMEQQRKEMERARQELEMLRQLYPEVYEKARKDFVPQGR